MAAFSKPLADRTRLAAAGESCQFETMASSPVDPIHGKPMTQGMRRALWAFFAVLSLGGMLLVSWQWRQQRQSMEARVPTIDRSRGEVEVGAPSPGDSKTPRKRRRSAAAGQGASARQ